jgi:hypothetical protein
VCWVGCCCVVEILGQFTLAEIDKNFPSLVSPQAATLEEPLMKA